MQPQVLDDLVDDLPPSGIVVRLLEVLEERLGLAMPLGQELNGVHKLLLVPLRSGVQTSMAPK